MSTKKLKTADRERSMLKPEQERLLELLVEQEERLAELYRIYAAKFPDRQEFWTELSGEEQQHAQWITSLLNSAKKGVLHFDEGRINIHTLNTFVKGIQSTIHKVRDTETSELSAVTYALDMENSLFEKNVFGHFEAVSDKARKILALLRRKTGQHHEKILAEKNLLLAQQP
jgi:hypothetical protein